MRILGIIFLYTFDITSGDANIYINGISSAYGNHNNGRGGSPSFYAASSTIGTAADGTGYYFNGAIDDFRLYNRALTWMEAKQLYQLALTKVKP